MASDNKYWVRERCPRLIRENHPDTGNGVMEQPRTESSSHLARLGGSPVMIQNRGSRMRRHNYNMQLSDDDTANCHIVQHSSVCPKRL